ncbi:MAG: hypothetical protein PHR71_01980 [Polaromonas sp.]|nr:hypothetical protein [Polaromonas sp.]
MIVTQAFPDEYSIAYPFIKEAMELAKARGLDGISPAMLKGFAPDPGLRVNGFSPHWMDGMYQYDLGGLAVS